MANPANLFDDADQSLSHREDGLRRRVLYAEDQPTARVVTTALLQRMGFDVVAVEDGELALEQAKQGAYDLILLDIEMPVMDGVTAARHIRKDAVPCRGTPILALSAFLADSTEHCHWRDAFDSALPKPANSNELKEAMRKAIAASSGSRPDAALQHDPVWARFGKTLPRGTAIMLVKTAHAEMHHLINSLAACLDAGDSSGAVLSRKGLLSLARSFQVEELALMAGSPAGNVQISALFSASDSWLRQHMPN